jgi:hypothetical protein
VAIVPVDRQSLLRQGFTVGTETPEDTADAVPPPGFQRLATARYYSAYVRC